MTTIRITHLQCEALHLVLDKLYDLGERLPQIAGRTRAVYMGGHDTLDPSAKGENECYDGCYKYQSASWKDWRELFQQAVDRHWPKHSGVLKLATLSESERALKSILKVGIEAVGEIAEAVEKIEEEA